MTGLYAHQAETWEAVARGESVVVTTGTASGKSLAFSLPVLDAIAREPATRALFLYPTKALAQDQARWLASLGLRGPAARDLRRRHADRAARAHPADGERDPHEPGHAPRRRPAPPRPLGRRAPQPARRRRRRGARLPRHLRLARRERAAPPAAAGARLRRRPGLRARLGDDRERGRARDAAHGARRPGRRRRHVAAGRARGRALEPRAARPGARHARERARRRVAAARRARRARPPHDLLHEEPQGGGARPPLRERPARPRDRPPARAVPRRLHARAAPRDRAAARRGRAARRDVDGRARARDRHRLARLRDLGRLPRHGRVAPAAVGPRRSAERGARRADRERGRRSTSSSCPSRRRSSSDGGGRADRPRDAADARRPRARRGLRGAADPCGRRVLGPEALERAALLPELEPTAAGYVWRGRDTPAARVSLRSGDAEAFVIVDEESGAVLGTAERERAYSTVHEGAVYLHLGEQYGVTALDLETRTALVRPVAVDWYTQARKETETAIVESLRTTSRAGVELHLGRLAVSRAGRRLPAQGDRRRKRDRHDPLELPARRRSRPRASGSRPPTACSAGSTRCRRSSRRSTPPSTR